MFQIDSEKNAVVLTKPVAIGSGFHPTDLVIGFERFDSDWKPIVERAEFVYIGNWGDFNYNSRKKIMDAIDDGEYDEVETIYNEKFV